MKSHELASSAERIVKELPRRLNAGRIGLQDDAEQRIVEFLNWVGDLMVQEVVEGVEEPTRRTGSWWTARWRCSSRCATCGSSTGSGNTWYDRGGATGSQRIHHADPSVAVPPAVHVVDPSIDGR